MRYTNFWKLQIIVFIKLTRATLVVPHVNVWHYRSCENTCRSNVKNSYLRWYSPARQSSLRVIREHFLLMRISSGQPTRMPGKRGQSSFLFKVNNRAIDRHRPFRQRSRDSAKRKITRHLDINIA